MLVPPPSPRLLKSRIDVAEEPSGRPPSGDATSRGLVGLQNGNSGTALFHFLFFKRFPILLPPVLQRTSLSKSLLGAAVLGQCSPCVSHPELYSRYSCRARSFVLCQSVVDHSPSSSAEGSENNASAGSDADAVNRLTTVPISRSIFYLQKFPVSLKTTDNQTIDHPMNFKPSISFGITSPVKVPWILPSCDSVHSHCTVPTEFTEIKRKKFAISYGPTTVGPLVSSPRFHAPSRFQTSYRSTMSTRFIVPGTFGRAELGLDCMLDRDWADDVAVVRDL